MMFALVPTSRAYLALIFAIQSVSFMYPEAVNSISVQKHQRIQGLCAFDSHDTDKTMTLADFDQAEAVFKQLEGVRIDIAVASFIYDLVSDMGGNITNLIMMARIVPQHNNANRSFWRWVHRLHVVNNSEKPWVYVPPNRAAVKFARWGAEFDELAERRDNEGMARLVRQILAGLGGGCLDEHALFGFVPFFSGVADSKPFGKMVGELVSLSKSQASWVQLPQGAKEEEQDPVFYLSQRLMRAPPRSDQGLDEVVGRDGVLRLALPQTSPDRANFAEEVLAAAEIGMLSNLPVTNATQAEQEHFQQSCPLQTVSGTTEWCAANGKVGPGCTDGEAQATVDLHRRALFAASQRSHDWTAILEDDLMPVHPSEWGTNFRKAWMKIPSEVRIVRLTRCTSEKDVGPVRKRNTTIFAGNFQIVDWPFWTDSNSDARYYVGGCTAGYIVHKDIIPEILAMFPCCCAFSCCIEKQFFLAPGQGGKRFRGEEIMTNLDHWDARLYANNHATYTEEGVLMKDIREMSRLQ